MGCKCENAKEEEKAKEISPDEDMYYKMFPQLKPAPKNDQDSIENYNDYPQRILEIINQIRSNPYSYASKIEDAMDFIDVIKSENNPNQKPKIIFNKKVRVILTKGEPIFRETANLLRELDPLPPFTFRQDLCINLPTNENDMKNSSFLKEQVQRMGTRVNVYFKDLIKVPEISALLMIVDDNGENTGKKRKVLLNKELKYIGINSGFVGNNKFIAYFAFSK